MTTTSTTFDLHGAIDEAAELAGDQPLDGLTKKVMLDSLRFMVGKQMFCPITSTCLDYRSAVVVTCGNNVLVIDGNVWDRHADLMVRTAAEDGVPCKVLALPLIKAASR